VTSNREPTEWLSMMSDALLAPSAVDRLTSGAHTLILEGPSCRQRDAHNRHATLEPESETAMLTNTSKWSHARGNDVVPSPWQATPDGSGTKIPSRCINVYGIVRASTPMSRG
jgi:hypothetical protein